MSDARWFLKRFTEDSHLVILVVQERAPSQRGVAMIVTGRPDARRQLPGLRTALAERLALVGAQVKTFDPVETDGG